MALYFSGTAQKDKQIIVAPYMIGQPTLMLLNFSATTKEEPASSREQVLLAS